MMLPSPSPPPPPLQEEKEADMGGAGGLFGDDEW